MLFLSRRQSRFAGAIAAFLALWITADYYISTRPVQNNTMRQKSLQGIEDDNASPQKEALSKQNEKIDAGKIARELKPKLIDVNSADVYDLMKLPTIGRERAKRIIRYRKEHGKFKSIDELVRVKGIGRNSLKKFRHLVIVR